MQVDDEGVQSTLDMGTTVGTKRVLLIVKCVRRPHIKMIKECGSLLNQWDLLFRPRLALLMPVSQQSPRALPLEDSKGLPLAPV